MDFRYNSKIYCDSLIKKFFNNKTRKLKNHYKLNDEIIKELKEYFNKIESTEQKSVYNEMPQYYYLKTNIKIIRIEDEEEIKELKDILIKVDEIFSLYKE